MLLAGNTSKVIVLEGETAGAICSCLMATSEIDNDDELIIANSDQIIDVDYSSVIEELNSKKCSGGVITFDNIHPRWSYARTKDDEVVEIAEKRPISKNAIAGFYYYKKGHYFIEYAKKAVLKGKMVNGKYYISESLNEMILDGMKIGYSRIEREKYHSFYSPEKIKEYEMFLGGKVRKKQKLMI